MIKIKIIVVYVLANCTLACYTAYSQHVGARFKGMGGACAGLEDPWSILNNQAGMSDIAGTAFGLSVHNHYLLEDLNHAVTVLVVPMNRIGIIGLKFSDMGFSVYRENNLGLAYARAFGNKISIGLCLNYNRASLGKEYGNQNYLGFDLGVIYKPLPHLSLAMHTSNPYSLQFSQRSNERLNSCIIIGLAYTIKKVILLSFDCEKVTSLKTRFKTGLEYSLKDRLFLRTGMQSSPFQYAFGMGYHLGRLKVDIASTYHHYLGFSPTLSIIYSFYKSGRG
jgi:hypothetical protein